MDEFEAALAAGLLGADRAPAASTGSVPDADFTGDPGGALLARMAVQGIRHLAGAGLESEILRPLPPGPPPGQECPPAAAARLALLLAAGPSARQHLLEWCALAARAGVSAPAWMLPALIPLRKEAPTLIDPVAGSGLDWLARALACDKAAETQEGPERDWTNGSPAERKAAFIAFRHHDPQAARTALSAFFRDEKADMRQLLVEALDTGLDAADEPFLEACLDDRAAGVRAAAQHLLPLLSSSRFADRMTARVGTALGVEEEHLPGGTGQALVVTLPEESSELARDGVTDSDRQEEGQRASLLRGILAAAPLRALATHPPRMWLDLAARSDWSSAILGGITAAARRERHPVWIRELAIVLDEMAAGRHPGANDPKHFWPIWARAAGLLPPAEWEDLAGRAFRTHDAEAVIMLLEHAPPAFSATFSEMLIAWIAETIRASQAGREGVSAYWVIDRAGRACEPGEGSIAAAAALMETLPVGTVGYVDGRLRVQATGLAESLALRLAMRRDFNPGKTP